VGVEVEVVEDSVVAAMVAASAVAAIVVAEAADSAVAAIEVGEAADSVAVAVDSNQLGSLGMLHVQRLIHVLTIIASAMVSSLSLTPSRPR
jgi:hypothetical protein